MGRNVGYAYLSRWLNSMWKPKCRMEQISLENDYFFVKFGSNEDLEYAMFEGPWMVLDHYLIVKEWVPNFDPMVDTTQKVLVWVRFLNLPVEYYNLLTMRKIGNKLGRTVRVDHTMSLVSRGKFARVCVEIDITKPLISRFTLEEKVWQVAYEGMHLVCFSCELYGHRQEVCPTSPMPAATAEPVPRSEEADHSNDPRVSGPHSGSCSHNLRSLPSGAPYGPWMIVSRKERRQGGRPVSHERQGERSRPTGASNPATFTHTGLGSRFALLDSKGEANDQHTTDTSEQPPNEESEPRLEAQAVPNSIPSSSALGRESRRANVSANKKQIVNEPAAPVSVGGENTPTSGRKSNASCSRRAAEEDEHVVIRGEQGGNLINSMRVSNGENATASMPTNVCPPTEHHGDPPEAFDAEGDVVMEIKDVPASSQRVADTPPV
ncbi:uncharacterized protein LOC116029675 [Ipomoea triloba]|uniref:uncharacterized protein LOC116029675 n=1 Tax=Ipomoea triloba TaxID=35885 RepID=UPI00125CE51B|nr:uncharacterized protein LOC116029675 [Ipomoea triloba]